ncbi:MAG: hypothetical protein AW07_04304 [Candidatus Accumulibacter sp. SK-11]|nr:MAG: hypothetical protein AW07_04304 [Candidatus Accumulibacter sp. SK-11]
MLPRTAEDGACQVEPVVAAGKCQRRFVPVFGRQAGHRRRPDVGRIGDDQVVAAAAEAGEEVALKQADAVAELVVGDVAPGDGEGVGRQVDGIDAGGRKGLRGNDRQATRAGAQVEDAADRLRLVDPGCELLVEQFGNERTGDDHPLIDVEAMLAEPGFVAQVGGRQPFADPPVDQAQRAGALVAGQPGVEERLEPVEWQVQVVQQEVDGFVPGVVRSVAEEQLRLVEAADGEAQQVTQGDQLFAGVLRHRRAATARGCGGRSLPVAAGRRLRRIH